MSNRARLALDLGLFVAILVAFFPRFTGISVHEWLSLAILAPTVLHLAVNWDWVVRTAVKIFGKLRAASRVNLVIDVLLFIATVTVMLSGFMVSQAIASTLGMTVVPSVAWHLAHAFSAKAVMLLMTAHFALHWQWITRVTHTMISRTRPPEPALVAIRTDNRRAG